MHQENDQSSQNEESESEESKETQAVEKQAEEVNEKELVDEETQPKEEEVEPPSLISFDATDDLLVSFGSMIIIHVGLV